MFAFVDFLSADAIFLLGFETFFAALQTFQKIFAAFVWD